MKIEYLIFDLDNTLYPSTGKMDKGISKRMLDCVIDFFKISEEEAIEKRKQNIMNFSTTLEWLRSEGLTDVEGFFSKVHPQNEADELTADEKLRPFLESLPYPKTIFTNSPREHAIRVLTKLNVLDLFDSICDIRDCSFLGKPYESAFKIALQKAGKDATTENTIFLDDMVKYTDGYESLGGTAVLIGNKNGKKVSANAACNTRTKKYKSGKTYRLETIYELPKLLKTLSAN